MSPEKLARAMSLLTRPIPPARRPAAKPQASWQGLKVGQRLKNTDWLNMGVVRIPALEVWEVKEVNSLGAVLATVNLTGAPFYHLRRSDWTFLFERVKAPRKRKAPAK